MTNDELRTLYVADLGLPIVSLAEFKMISEGGLMLHSFTQEKLLTDSSANKWGQLKTILRTWRQRRKIKKRARLTIAIPSQMVLTRFLKLPGTRCEDIHHIIAFEAQQNIPFPLSEVVWDYQIIGSSVKGHWDVVLVATKKVPLAALRRDIMEAGFLLERTDTAPTALYNAFRYNYSENKGCTLIINIGTHSTNLIFSEEEKVFIRTIPSILSQKITPPHGGEKYQESQNVEPPLAYKATIPLCPEIKRLRTEIDRSISFYCSHQGGSPPQQILFYGSAHPQEIFNDRLQIQDFNPLRNVQSTSETAAKAQMHTLGEVVGLATHALKNVPLEIQLLSPEAIHEAALARRKLLLAIASICLIFSLASSWLYFFRTAAIKAALLERSKNQASRLDIDTHRLQTLSSQNEQLKTDLLPLVLALADRTIWPTLIHTLETSLPSKFIWMTRLEPIAGSHPILPAPEEWNKRRKWMAPQKEHQLLIEGLYLENPRQATVVDDFVHNLSQSSFFTIPDKAKVIRVRDTPDGEHWAYRYTLLLPLPPPQ